MSRKASNKLVADILARSRKRHLIYIFSAQVIDTIDKRIRKVQDFTAYPLLSRGETDCKVIIFRTGFAKNANFMKTFYYKTWIPFSTYDTDFEVDMIDDTDTDEPAQPPKLIWQEGKARCLKCKAILTTGIECPECGSKEIQPIEPMIFNDWETADKIAQDYWEKTLKKEGMTDTENEEA